MVLLPFAVDQHGDLIHVDDAIPSVAHRCQGCDRRVFRRAGSKQAHFYHRDPGGCSDGQTALHQSAIHMIEKGFNDAKIAAGTYKAVVRCAWCEISDVQIDLATIADQVIVEKKTVDVFLPDVSLSRKGNTVLAIEVVVTSDMSDEKVRKFNELAMPSLVVRPTEASLLTMDRQLAAPESLVVMCDQCKDQLEVRKRYPATYDLDAEFIDEAIRVGYYGIRNLPVPVDEPEIQIEADGELEQEIEPEPRPISDDKIEPAQEPAQLEMTLDDPVAPIEKTPLSPQPTLLDRMFNLWVSAKLAQSIRTPQAKPPSTRRTSGKKHVTSNKPPRKSKPKGRTSVRRGGNSGVKGSGSPARGRGSSNNTRSWRRKR